MEYNYVTREERGINNQLVPCERIVYIQIHKDRRKMSSRNDVTCKKLPNTTTKVQQSVRT
jgi:hypothetical protein